MRIYLILLLCFFLYPSYPVHAQGIISGRVIDSVGNGVGNATVICRKPGSLAASAHAITSADGAFSLENKIQDADSVELTVSHMAYQGRTVVVPNKTGAHTIVLRYGNTMLEEVVVSNMPIFRNKDTIEYAVDAFAFKGDRVIEDVIRKLPGIEIIGGQIFYQGKPIQQYKVNNLDLMGGRYAMINKNLPLEAVQNVQIMENDQPIKILDSLIISDRASLNLELKEFTTTGSGKVSTGMAPLLWDVSLTPMTFGKSFQMLNSFQTNNTGNDATGDLKPFYTGEKFFGAQVNNSEGPSFVSIGDVTTPGFDERKWMDNRLYLLSSNMLQKLKGGTEIRGNISYYNDLQERQGLTTTKFFAPDQQILLTEQIGNSYRTNDLVAGVLIEKNEKQIYLRNKLNYHGRWNDDRGWLGLNQLDEIEQDRSYKDFSLMNSLSAARFIGKQLVSIQSDIEIGKTPQYLSVWPGQLPAVLHDGLPYDRMQQDVIYNSFHTANQIKFTRQFGRLAMTPSFALNYQSNGLETAITTTVNDQDTRLGEGYTNDMNVRRVQMTPAMRFDYRKDSWKLILIAPYNLYTFNVDQQGIKSLDNKFVNTFNPSFTALYTVDGSNEFGMSTSYGKKFEGMDYFYNAFIVDSYRSIQKYDARLLGSTDFNSSVSYRYKNTLAATFANLGYAYTGGTNDYLLSNAVDSIGQMTLQVLDRESRRFSHEFSAGYSRLLPAIKTTVKVKANASLGQSDFLLNDVIGKQRTRAWEGTIELFNSSWDFLGLSYKLDYGDFKTRLSGTASNNVIHSNHYLEINAYYRDNHRFTVFNAYHQNNIEGMTAQYFLDVEYQWSLEKFNTDIKFTVMNVFDNKRFTQQFSDDYRLVVSEFDLRPRQLMISTHFRF